MNDSPHEPVSVPQKFRAWLSRAVEAGASDLHLIVGYPPVLRLHGELQELSELPLTTEETQPLFTSLCPPDALARLQVQKNIDFSFGLVLQGRICRFRANLFHADRQMGACFRVVPTVIPDFQWAEFPLLLAERLAFLLDGLVIVTGATGSGKT